MSGHTQPPSDLGLDNHMSPYKSFRHIIEKRVMRNKGQSASECNVAFEQYCIVKTYIHNSLFMIRICDWIWKTDLIGSMTIL